ncbi:alpha/beta hydrolase [Aquibium carbonis]|uniref:Alpha/beta hydrolase n=1 Tax=Aquibium carbonis TaxID=2495581 RepID=A0A429Z195_9HYPH|nr:alpha/beta hydrolase [Aquibium carbonis]RST87420.1 alpha/beta hydrolase [Aquibium carbonis]
MVASDRREHRFQNRGTTVAYRTIGDGGPVFVFLHGFPDFWESLMPLAERINPTGTSVFLDLRGYNAAGQPDEPGAYGIVAVASDAAALARALGHRDMIFVGHDWGGAVAWWLWMQGAAGYRGYVSISAPHPSALLAGMQDDGQWQASAYARAIAADGGRTGFDRMQLAQWCEDPSHRARLVAALERSSAFAMASYYARNYPNARDARLDGLPAGRTPFLLVYGATDPYMMADTFERSRALGGDRVSVAAVEGGHFVHFSQTAAVSESIKRWLDHV